MVKRSRAFDSFAAEGNNVGNDLDGLTKVDFLLADDDYATPLFDAYNLKEKDLLTAEEFADLARRLKAKVKAGLTR